LFFNVLRAYSGEKWIKVMALANAPEMRPLCTREPKAQFAFSPSHMKPISVGNMRQASRNVQRHVFASIPPMNAATVIL